MASVRTLKKEIHHLTNLVLEDCLLLSMTAPSKKDEIEKIMENVVSQNTALLQKAGKNKQSREDYKNIRKELIVNTDKVFEDLDKIVG